MDNRLTIEIDIKEEKRPISTMEWKVKRSKLVPPELKKRLQEFRRDYQKAFAKWRDAGGHMRSKERSDLYDIRNKAIDYCFGVGAELVEQKQLKAALDVANFTLFYMADVVGYDDVDMIFIVKGYARSLWRRIHRNSKSAEEAELWEYFTKNLNREDFDRLPEPVLFQEMLEFVVTDFSKQKYMQKNWDFLEDLIYNALSDENELALEIVVLQKLELMEMMDVTPSEYHTECLKWWDITPVRLTYLEYCMVRKSYQEAMMIAIDCLTEAEKRTKDGKLHEFMLDDDLIDELVTSHRVLLGCYYKMDKIDKAVAEAKWLAENSPETLVWDMQGFLVGDKVRWNKTGESFAPFFEQAAKQTFRPGI